MFFVGCQCQHNSRSHDHAKLCKLFVLKSMFVSHISLYFNTTRQANRCIRYGSVYDHNVSFLTLSWPFSAVLQTWNQTLMEGRTDRQTDLWTDGRTDGADGETLIEMRGRIWKSFLRLLIHLPFGHFCSFWAPLARPLNPHYRTSKMGLSCLKKLLSGSNHSFTDYQTERSS